MGHNSVVSSYLKSLGILRVNGLSMGPPGFGASQIMNEISLALYFPYSK